MDGHDSFVCVLISWTFFHINIFDPTHIVPGQTLWPRQINILVSSY